MEYIDIKQKKYTKDCIQKAGEIIREGKIAIIPTDTVYGLATNALDEKAVKRIYNLKKRKCSNPMNVLVSNMEMIQKITENVSDIEKKIIEKFFPGPLTIILKKNSIISDTITSGLSTIGIRMPDNKFLLELIEFIGNPIVATSCNLAGEKPEIDIENILPEIKDKVDLIIDGGKSEIGVPSTVVKIEENDINILRKGPINKSEILKKII